MALIKEMPWKHGLTISYWIITDVNSMKIEGKTRVCVCGYLNKSDREASLKDALIAHSFDFEGIGHTMEYLYTKLKESSFDEEGNETVSIFSGALDDL